MKAAYEQFYKVQQNSPEFQTGYPCKQFSTNPPDQKKPYQKTIFLDLKDYNEDEYHSNRDIYQKQESYNHAPIFDSYREELTATITRRESMECPRKESPKKQKDSLPRQVGSINNSGHEAEETGLDHQRDKFNMTKASFPIIDNGHQYCPLEVIEERTGGFIEDKKHFGDLTEHKKKTLISKNHSQKSLTPEINARPSNTNVFQKKKDGEGDRYAVKKFGGNRWK